MTRALSTATSAALESGKFLRAKCGHHRTLSHKADKSLVTEADRGAERLIVRRIRKAFPEDTILGEESGLSEGTAAAARRTLESEHLGHFRWHIDPLDGTTNFVHAFPMFCVSIGLEHEDGDLVLGVIHNPVTGDTFHATLGGGACKNGKPIRVSRTSSVIDALLSTGFSYRRDVYYDRELSGFSRVLRECRAIRRIGSAALDLSLVACGQFDGFWEHGLSSWDVCAGIAILREAGGHVTNLSGEEYRLGDEGILATNRFLHPEILALIRERTS